MVLKEFLKNIQDLVEENPKSLEYLVVYSKDDEGNEFNPVSFKPEIGYYDDRDKNFDDSWGVEAICIN